MRESTIKVVSFNIFGLGAVGTGLFFHVIQPLFENDKSFLCYVLAITQGAIVLLSIYDSFFPTRWVKNFIKFEESNLRILGLIGTLVGLLMLVAILGDAANNSASSAANTDFIKNIMIGFATGLRTAFGPTLVGIVAWYWTRHLLFFKRNDR